MDQPPEISSINKAGNNEALSSGSAGFTQKSLGQAGPQPIAAFTQPEPTPKKSFYHENRFYVWAIVFGAVVISVLSYFAFRKTPAVAPKEANVTISVDAPQTIPAGSQAVYKITVNNQDSQKLVGLSLELAYSDGMTFVSSSPNADNLSGSVFSIPDLVSGQNATIFVKAQVSGNVNDSKDLNIKLHYKYSNFNSDFVKEQTATVRLTASDITLDLTGPTTTNNSQNITYTLKYQNNSSNAISSARIQMQYPDGFSFATSQPPPDSGSNLWNIATLQPGDSGTITVQGAFNSANPGESKNITAQLLILGPDGQYFTQNTASFTTTLATLPLIVTQQVQNVDSSNVVNPGDTLNFTINYQNNSSVVASGVNVLATLNTQALDMSTLQAEGAQVSNNTILWNGSSAANLQSLNPSDSGQLTFSVRVKNPATKDSSKNLTIVSNIEIKSNEYSSFFPGNQVNLKISSPATVRATVAYQSGSQPPQVGKTTLYSVTLQLTNSTNDFSGGTLTALVPLGAGGVVAGSINSAESANVQFDASTGKLTWQVGPLLAHTGQFTASRTLQFGVRLIPSASQAGDEPTLVKNIQFNAIDTFTGQPVSAKADDITTGDTGNSSEGQVQP